MTNRKQIFEASNLAECAQLIHGFTTRELGNDYDRIAQTIKVLPSQIYSLEQIHSNTVVVLEKGMDLVHLPPGDALITQRKDVLIGVKTADCVPILVVDEDREVVAAIHAGHRGLAAGIVRNAICLLVDRFGCEAGSLIAAIGPCISVAHYEVGPEVILQFEQMLGPQAVFCTSPAARPHLDLRATTRRVLLGLGLDGTRISDVAFCTFERSDLFFSHRRQSGQGRQFSFIGMLS